MMPLVVPCRSAPLTCSSAVRMSYQAEQQLAASTARIGQAKADRFPKLSSVTEHSGCRQSTIVPAGGQRDLFRAWQAPA